MLAALVENALAAQAVVEILIQLDLSMALGADVVTSIASLDDLLLLAVDELRIDHLVLAHLQPLEEFLVLLLELGDLL